MAQENLHMLKRLQEKTSSYNFNKYEKEYNKAQYYKRSLCAFPSIDFYKTKRSTSLAGTPAYTPYNSQNNYYPMYASKMLNINSRKKKFEEFNYEDFVDIKPISKKDKNKKNEEKNKKNENKDKKENLKDENKNNIDKNEEENKNKDKNNEKENNNENEKKNEENKKNKEENENNKEETKEIENNKENEKIDENKNKEEIKEKEENNKQHAEHNEKKRRKYK